MNEVNKSCVRYFLSGSFYTVGNNATKNADGITDASYSGEIFIEDKINGKEVLEISQYAFQACSITRVIIYAKIRSINRCAFYCCVWIFVEVDYLYHLISILLFDSVSLLMTEKNSSVSFFFFLIMKEKFAFFCCKTKTK